ncbi:TfoX Regulator of competence-specific genes [Comamonadaceae bacterium]
MPAILNPAKNRQFADYCCDLLSTQGRCVAKRMFGGWGISVEGLTFAIIADLGGGDKLWLKADEVCRSRFEAAGCERFVYVGKSKTASMGYYTAPEEAMDSHDAMLPWARLSLECAIRANAAKATVKRAGPKKLAEKAAQKSRRD